MRIFLLDTFFGLLLYPIRFLTAFITTRLVATVSILNDSLLFDAVDKWFGDNYGNQIKSFRGKFKTEKVNDTQGLDLVPGNLMLLIKTKHGRILVRKKIDRYIEDNKEVLEIKYDLIALDLERIRKLLLDLEKETNDFNLSKGLCIVTGSHDYKRAVLRYKVFKTFDELFYPRKEELIQVIDNFIGSQKFYHQKKIKYKIGIILSGPPGTGKTDTAIAMAHYTNRPLYVTNLNNFMDDESFQEYIQKLDPCSIVLIDDIDDYIGDREKDGNGSKTDISFSSILNTLDGIYSPDNVIFVFTTNKYDNLDAAFVRPGRIDYVMYLGYPDGKHIRQYVANYYGVEDEKWISNSFYPNEPMSMIETICQKHQDHEHAKTEIKQLLKK